jgi:hypothetical protein
MEEKICQDLCGSYASSSPSSFDKHWTILPSLRQALYIQPLRYSKLGEDENP